MKYCPSCGSQIIGNIEYCNVCGTNIFSTRMPITQQQYSYQYPSHLPPFSRPPPKKAITAMVLAIISVIMLFIIGVLPWFSVTVENGIEGKEDYTLEEVIVETDYGNSEMDLDAIPNADFDDVADTTSSILKISTILMILVVVLLGLLIWFYYNNIHENIKMFKNILLLLVFIAMLLVLIAPIYYMVAWTEAMDDASDGLHDSFIGSEEIYGNDTTWGPGIGWILAFVCFILILVTFIYVKLSEEVPREIIPQISPAYQIQNLQHLQQPYPQPQYPQQQSQQPPQLQSQPQLKYCNGCGRQIPIESIWCTYCATKVG